MQRVRDLPVDHVFLRREAIEHGLSDTVLRRLVREGLLHKPRHGLYGATEWWSTASPEQRHLAVARAILRLYDDRVALSHYSAVMAHGIPVWDVDYATIHLTHTASGSGRTLSGVVHHRVPSVADDLVRIEGMQVTSVVRAVLDSTKLLDREHSLVIADGALRRKLCTKQELWTQLERQQRDPGMLGARLVVGLCDGRADSPAETRARHLFSQLQLPIPELQYPVYADHGELLGVVDFAWPELGVIVEVDGRSKYSTHLRPGESPADAVFREKVREDRIRERTGWIVVRLTWADLARPQQTAARLRRAFAMARATRGA